jgi:heme exporter protein CcmB
MVEWGLLLGTPGLAAIGVTIAALTAGRAGAALGGLLAIPLTVPLLIFGAGSLQPGARAGWACWPRAAWWPWRGALCGRGGAAGGRE